MNFDKMEFLGSGNSARVYKGIIDNNNVAFKVFKKSTQQQSVKAEIQNLSIFKHHNIIKLVSFDNDFQWLALEICKKATLYEMLQSTIQVKEPIARTIIFQIIHGLEHMHINGYVHRDIKLENICVGLDNFIRIADLGFLTKIQEGSQEYRMMGSPEYMALELFQPLSTIDSSDLAPADVYSLGVLIFALITKSFPYHQYDSKNPQNPKNKRIVLIYNERWDLYWQTFNTVQFTDSFKELIENMLRRDPSQRWTLDQVKNCAWMNQNLATEQEYFDYMNKFV